jgi:hypothetical protein
VTILWERWKRRSNVKINREQMIKKDGVNGGKLKAEQRRRINKIKIKISTKTCRHFHVYS